MSKNFQKTANANFDRFIQSCPDKKTAWKFFLRRSLRLRSFYGRDGYSIFFANKSRDVDGLRNKFETIYGRYFAGKCMVK